MKKALRFILIFFLTLLPLFFLHNVYRAVKYYKEPAPVAVEIGSLIAAEDFQNDDSVLQNQDLLSPEIKEASFGTNVSGLENEEFFAEESADVGNQEVDEKVSDQNFENAIGAPNELNLKMTFYSQAPFGDWNYPWQEACEEASVLLAANVYLDKNWSREQFNEEILKMVDWEMKRFGYYEHTSVEEMATILGDYFQLETVIHENPSFEQVKEILAKGHLIIMPFAGKKLGNPFYKNGGPVYHAMVIKGYTDDQKVITADVGTKQGEDYVYRWDVIQEALHDYAEPIESGAKRMIEVIPPA